MRRAIVVPIVKALGSLGVRVLAPEGLPATQLMCATALVLHCIRPISTHGLRGSIEVLPFRGDRLLSLRGPPAGLRGHRIPSCLANLRAPRWACPPGWPWIS